MSELLSSTPPENDSQIPKRKYFTSGLSEREESDLDLMDQGAEWQGLGEDSPWLYVPEDVQERIRRYELKLKPGKHNWYKIGSAPFAVVAPHALAPTKYELERIKRLNIESSIPDEKIKDHYDGYTGSMALNLVDSGASIFVSRRPRTVIDQNRSPGTHGTDIKFSGQKLNLVSDRLNTESLREYCILLRKAVENSVGLDNEGKALRPYLILSLHALTDHKPEKPGAEIIVGARTYKSAHKKVVQWFIERMQQLMEQSLIFRDSLRNAQVRPFIAFEESGARKRFTGTKVLEIPRYGSEELGFSGLGEGMQVMQLEIVASVRKNEERRLELERILTQIMQEFSQQFSTLESLSA